MARGRMLSKSIAQDEALIRLSEDAALFYLHTIAHLDRDGLITGRPLVLWSTVLPLRPRLMEIAGQLIDEWVQQGLVIRYPGARSGDVVLFFKGFRRNNQNIPYHQEAPSPHPPPPGWRRTAAGLVPEEPEQRLALAADFDPRSVYRLALEDPDSVDRLFAGKKGGKAQPAAGRWRPGADQVAYQDQGQDHDQSGRGGDHSITSTLQSLEGGSGGKERSGGTPSYLAEFSDHALRRAAAALGPLLFGEDFRGYASFVASVELSTLTRLLEWIAYFWERGDQMEGIRDLPAYIRACATRGDRPGLTTKMRAWLVEQVLQVQEV